MSGNNVEQHHDFPPEVKLIGEQAHSMGVKDFWHAAELYCRIIRTDHTEEEKAAYQAIGEIVSRKTQRQMSEVMAATVFAVDKIKCALSHPDSPSVMPVAVIEWAGRMARQAAAIAMIKDDLSPEKYSILMAPWHELFKDYKSESLAEAEEERTTEIPDVFKGLFGADG